MRVLCVDEGPADNVTESCVGRYFMTDYRHKQQQFPSARLKFGLRHLVFDEHL